MNYTPNYALNLWEKTDRIQMEDFNADNAKIEAALDQVNTTLSSTGYVIGTYTGTGDNSTPQSIALGFQPSAVLIIAAGKCDSSNPHYALVTPNYPVTYTGQYSAVYVLAEITDNGFRVGTGTYNNSAVNPNFNAAKTFCYIAFR